MSVRQAGELWLKSCDGAGLERATVDQYRQHLTLHIEPFVGTLKLNKVTVPVVRAFQETLRENGRSAAMVKRVTVSLGSILSDSLDRGLVARNAVHELRRRRKGGAKPENARRRAWLMAWTFRPWKRCAPFWAPRRAATGR